MITFDSQALRSQDYSLTPPFRLAIARASKNQTLACNAILRHLPGKRIVCDGIWRHDIPVVAKIFLDASGAQRHFQRELQGIKALQAAHIPTPELLLEGTLADGLSPLLLFRKMEGFQSLSERAPLAINDDHRLQIIGRVVTVIARLHAAGLRQRDIHPGNFLLSGSEVMVIDGDDIVPSSGRPMDRQASLSNLTLFLAQFDPSFDTLASQLIKTYATAREWKPDSLAGKEILKQIRRWRHWRQKKYLLKTQRTCTAFRAEKSWRRFVVWDREWYSSVWDPLLENPDGFIESGTILKAGNSATVARVTIDGQTVVVKRYNIKNVRHALRRALRPSRAMVSWTNAHRLRFLGIATPHPHAVIEERWFCLRKRAYFIMAHLPGDTVDNVFGAKAQDKQALGGMFDQLELLLQRLAAAKISHGDFKATNFLISSGKLYIADLDGMQTHRGLLSFKRAFHRDLERLQRNWQDSPDIHSKITDLVDRLNRALDIP